MDDRTTAGIGELIPWENNPRINTNAAKKLARYIKEDGWGAPILVQAGTNRIIAGHTRHKAALLLGMTEVPVRFIECDDRRATRLALADNKLAEEADWDPEMLAQELEAFGLEGAELMGWDSKELEALADQVASFGPLDVEGGEVPEAPVCEVCGQKTKEVA